MNFKEGKTKIKTIQVNRTRNPENRHILLQTHDKCQLCGISFENTVAEAHHVIPLEQGGENSLDNIILLCPNCHSQIHRQRITELDFEKFIGEIMTNNSIFTNVQIEHVITDNNNTKTIIDIIANRKIKNGTETILVECKTHLSNINSVIHQFEMLSKAYRKKCQLVIATPQTLSDNELRIFNQKEIEVWDRSFITKNFSEEIKKSYPSYYKAFFLNKFNSMKQPNATDIFIEKLKKCNPGLNEALIYQKLVGDIFEYLFSQSLDKPLSELNDYTKSNRRDFIMPNYKDQGFWAFIRTKYNADYVVIDAKNYSRTIRKQEILQIANYLKEHGAGLFGIIVSRKGGDSNGCLHTLREQWLLHHKMILVLNDNDVIKMLLAKSDNGRPEDILKEKIQNFRLSI